MTVLCCDTVREIPLLNLSSSSPSPSTSTIITIIIITIITITITTDVDIVSSRHQRRNFSIRRRKKSLPIETRRQLELGGSPHCPPSVVKDVSQVARGNEIEKNSGPWYSKIASEKGRSYMADSNGTMRFTGDTIIIIINHHRRCVHFEGRQHERAPRSVKADVSRHCSPWRWGSMIRRRRSSETCWSSGSTSGSISPRPSAKECTVLGTWRNPALFRLPGGSPGTESRVLKQQLLQLCANSNNGTRRDQCSGLRWMVISFLLSLTVLRADPRHLRREISAAIDQQLWAQAPQHEHGKGLQQGVDLHATRRHLARLRKRGQHKEANFLMACLTGALWPLQRQHDCPRSGETPIDPACKRCEEGCAETLLHRHWLCAGNLFDHPNEAGAPGTFSSSSSGGSGHAMFVVSGLPPS